MNVPLFIGVDWGSSNIRAFLVGDEGQIVDRRAAARRLTSLDRADFLPLLNTLLTGWQSPALPVLLCGMVGSQQGWVEAPYVQCPANANALAAAAISPPAQSTHARIIPGVMADDGNLIDVMRGEEVQIIGSGVADGLVILPGTHSKWADIVDGTIRSFQTFMTGELRALLIEHSLLGRSMAGDVFDEPAFDLGVRRGAAARAFTGLLFSVRTEALSGRLPPEALASYLSGLLIGCEVAARSPGDLFTIVGDSVLARLYARALGQPLPDRAAWGQVQYVDGDVAVARGLFRLYQQMQPTWG